MLQLNGRVEKIIKSAHAWLVCTAIVLSVVFTAPVVSAQNRVRADAGPDQTVRQGATVRLDGSASFFPSGVTPNYLWDPDDASIALSLVNGVSPTFTAPSGFTGDRVIEITLTVVGADDPSSDTVRITVRITVRADATLPVITLNGANPQIIERGTAYTDLGAMATDNIDGDITGDIAVAVHHDQQPLPVYLYPPP